MQEYGVPQRRKRVIIVGNREGVRFSYPEAVTSISGKIYRSSSVTLRAAIADLESKENLAINHVFKQENPTQ